MEAAEKSAIRMHDPLHDWRVGLRSVTDGADGGDVQMVPLVGREDLLRRLDRLTVQAEAGQPVVITLSGEAGIGKTRLIRAFAERVAGLGFDARWSDRLNRQDKTAPLVLLGPTQRVVLADGVVPWTDLRQVADLHSTEPASLVVLTMCPSEHPATKQLHELLAVLARRRRLVDLPLPPLEPTELAGLVAHRLGAPPDARLQWMISTLSEGNPLLAEEIVLDLQRNGLIGRQQGSWLLREEVPPDYVPASVVAMVRHRLAILKAEIIATLSVAAVIGSGFQFDTLVAALGLSSDRVLAHLEEAARAGVLRESADSPDDFQFTHELVRRVVYGSLGRIRRRCVHQSVALAYEAVAGIGSSPEQSATLAYHLRRGTQPDRALDHVLFALDSAEQMCAWEDAIQYCREGLKLARQVDAENDRQLLLLERLAALYWGRAETFAAAACWHEAR